MLNILETIQTHTSVILSITIEIVLSLSILFIFLYLIFNGIKTWHFLKKYSNSKNNFEIRRCLEDGSKEERHHYYLIDDDNKTYQRIVDSNTFNKIFKGQGFVRPSREDKECFSKKDYEEKEKIEFKEDENTINNLIDIIKVLKP